MNNNEILKRARNEGNDEFEQKQIMRADIISYVVTISVAAGLILIDLIKNLHLNWTAIAITCSGMAVSYIREGKIYKRNGKLVYGIVLAVIAILSLIVSVSEIIGL